MLRVKSFLRQLPYTGVSSDESIIGQKEIIISNKISLVLLPLALIGIIMSANSEVYFTTLGFSFFAIFLFFVFPLNKLGKSGIVRFGLSVFPQLFLLIPNLISGDGNEENYLSFSYLFIGFSIIPLLLFDSKKERDLLIIALFINFMVILFFDILMFWTAKNNIGIELIENNYEFYKLPQIILWIAMISVFYFLKNESSKYKHAINDSNRALNKATNEFNGLYEELSIKSDLLSEKELIIETQANKLINSKNELNNTKLELLNTIEHLKDAKVKMLQREAEAKSILNAMSERYLLAEYDLNGSLKQINTKMQDLLGAAKSELFQSVKPIVDLATTANSKELNGSFYTNNWEKVIQGAAQTMDIKLPIGKKTLYLSITLAPLINSINSVYGVLVIGQDITELTEKSKKIEQVHSEMKEKVFEISQQNQVLNFQQREIFEKSEELHRQKEEIQAINESLEERVQERTKVLEAKNKQLAEYAFINSHVLRSPVSTMMGLINLMSYSKLPPEDQKIYEHLTKAAQILDGIVFKINDAIQNRFDFDRQYIEPERAFEPVDKTI